MGKTKTIQDYENAIRELHEQLLTYPDSETLNKRMYIQLSAWEKLLPIIIFQAQQEQMPWTEQDLGYQVRPMPLKKNTDVQQTGDYQAYYQSVGYSGWIPFLVERKGGEKGPEDLYGTFSSKEHRERFYREIDRFKEDNRFERMYLIAECSYDDFLKYVPPFIGNKRNVNHICVSVETRRATIAGLYTRGCTVIFAGNRNRAIQMYKDLIRQWLIKNYSTVLGLDKKPYDDIEFLRTKKAMLEAELAYVNDALKVTA
jgi:hypothetical protein